MAIKRKHGGRQELRKVTRTSRRDREEDEVEETHEQVEQPESEEEEIEDTDKSRAYNALLTLLDNDAEPETKKSKMKKSEEEEDEEIEGFNLEEDEEDEEDEEPEEYDSDDDSDPFKVHFDVDDEFEAQQDIKWSVKSKSNVNGYNSIFQVASQPLPTNDSVKPLEKLHIKKRILNYIKDDFNTEETTLLNAMLQYKDINYPYFNYKNQSYKKLYVIHALNHIYKTRDTILKNNSKLSSHAQAIKEGKSLPDLELRDQGFTRPKVLILLPTREACHDVVNLIIKYSAVEQKENRKRFNAQFHNDANPPDSKPDDFKYYFKGNTNDYFTLGLKFTRKSIKLYSSFYSSDIIIASPIGLSMILENPDKRKREYDFLSSIEMVILDNANQIEMQNWDHVKTVFKYINKVPKKSHETDFSRIRMWSINDQAKYFTQRLVFSEFLTPNINSVINKSTNLSGRLKYKKVIDSSNCIMNSVGLKIRQVFQRFESPSPMADPDFRFKFFTNSIINSFSNSSSYDDGLLIIISSYFDYVRVKEFMHTTKLTWDAVDEYTPQSKLTRARHHFIQGKTKVLIYTERLHYFRRFEIGGVKNILLYGIPNNPIFYKEYLKFIGKSVFNNVVDLNLCFVKAIFSKWDAAALERVVGERAPVLCNSVNETFEFK